MGVKTIQERARAILRLWWLYARMDAVWITRVPSFFVTYYLSDMVLSVAAVTSVVLLAERFQGIGPWTQPHILFMLGYATLVSGIVYMFFGYNVLMISRRVGRGQLDHMLIQPQPLWLILLTEGFLPFSGSAVLLPGIALIGWSLGTLGMPLSGGWWGWFGLNVVASSAITVAFVYLWGSLAFWAPRSAEEISTESLRLVDQLKVFPFDGLQGFLVGGLLTFLPAGFVTWMPSRFLMGIDARPVVGLATPAASLVFGLLALVAFKKGLVHYGRTGSQRYLGLGHRR